MSIQWTVATEESTGEVGPYATPFAFTLSAGPVSGGVASSELVDVGGAAGSYSGPVGGTVTVGEAGDGGVVVGAASLGESARGTASFTLTVA